MNDANNDLIARLRNGTKLPALQALLNEAADKIEEQGNQIKSERKYLIVCNEHRSWPTGALLFWGHRTADSESRSFGGYTTQLEKCERYTREEVEAWRKGAVEHYPFFDEIKPNSLQEFRAHEEVVCTLDELRSFGFKVWTVVCRE